MGIIEKNQQPLTKINFFSDKVKGTSNIDDLFSELFSLVNLEGLDSVSQGTNSQALDGKNEKMSPNDEKTLKLASSLAEVFYEELGINPFYEDKEVSDKNSNVLSTNFLKKESNNFLVINNFPKSKTNIQIHKKNFTRIEQNKNNDPDVIEINIKSSLDPKKISVNNSQLTNNSLSNSIKLNANFNLFNKKKMEENNLNHKNNNEKISNTENLILKKSTKKNKQFLINPNDKNIDIKKSSLSKSIVNLPFKNQVSTQNSRKSSSINEIKTKFSNKNNLNIDSQKKNPSNSSFLSQETLDLMESGWGEKLAKIIKSSIQNRMDKVDIKLNPKNLGKIKLEIVTKKNSSTQINFVAEAQETVNILNENLYKLEEIFENKGQKFGTTFNNGGNSFGSNKENKNKNEEKEFSFKKEKKLLNTTGKNIHNIDVKA
tara:strand:+ start:366 stop:1655 length:1290 start_codon:yes stop_codon:yes gene_type:complete